MGPVLEARSPNRGANRHSFPGKPIGRLRPASPQLLVLLLHPQCLRTVDSKALGSGSLRWHSPCVFTASSLCATLSCIQILRLVSLPRTPGHTGLWKCAELACYCLGVSSQFAGNVLRGKDLIYSWVNTQ